MSHFTCLVVGPDADTALAPYHEFECTGVDDQYVQDVDNTAEVQEKIAEALAEGKSAAEALEEGLGWFGLEDRIVEREEDVDKSSTHKYGYAIVVDGKLIKSVDRTNPNKKWDWYQQGGRWQGYFTKKKSAKSGDVGEASWASDKEADLSNKADSILKGDIDFEAMEKRVYDKYFDYHVRLSDLLTVSDFDGFKSWKTVIDEMKESETDYDAVRKFYHSQPLLARLKEILPKDLEEHYLGWGGEPSEILEALGMSAEDYARSKSDGCWAPFSMVLDGHWAEKGRMGWWATVSDEKPESEWRNFVKEKILALPDDTLLTLVDCHI